MLSAELPVGALLERLPVGALLARLAASRLSLPDAAEPAMLPARAATATKEPTIAASRMRIGAGRTSGRRACTSAPLPTIPPVCGESPCTTGGGQSSRPPSRKTSLRGPAAADDEVHARRWWCNLAFCGPIERLPQGSRCRGRDSNPHAPRGTPDFKSPLSDLGLSRWVWASSCLSGLFVVLIVYGVSA